jgi:hypothetical protein
MNGTNENFLKASPAQSHSDCDFLTFLGTPTGAIHHPEEVGFDPTHAAEAKFTTKELVLSCVFSNGWPVSLIHDNCVRIELGEDVLTGLGPPLKLL